MDSSLKYKEKESLGELEWWRVGVGVVACGGWSGGVCGLEWWHVGVGVVAGGGSSGGIREIEWWHIQCLIIDNVLYPT